MALEQNKRPKRTPLTNEEVANVIAYKKRRDLIHRLKFKNSRAYKMQNMFNVLCFFICCELLVCFLFPSNYHVHLSKTISVKHGDIYNKEGKAIVSKIIIHDTDDNEFELLVDEFIEVDESQTLFFIAKDYVLQKELKGRLDYFVKDYSLFTASPILLLCAFTIIISLIIYLFNLNENAHSLTAVTVLNTLIMAGLLVI